MRCLGLLSPYGWPSADYYLRTIHQDVRNRTGGLHSAKLVLHCLDLQETDRLVTREDWPALTRQLIDAARQVEAAGAEGLLLCSFTMHRFAEEIAAAVSLPLLHIADSLAVALDYSRSTLGILGPSAALAAGPLAWQLGRNGRNPVALPSAQDSQWLDAVIFDQVCQGFTKPGVREELLEIFARFRQRRVSTFVLGCPELAERLLPEDYIPSVYHAPEIHAAAAVDWMLATPGPAPRKSPGRPLKHPRPKPELPLPS